MTTVRDRPGVLEQLLGGGPLDLEVGGRLVPADAVGPVTVRRGRSRPDARFEPAQLTATLYADALEQLPRVGDELRAVLSEATLRRFGLWGDELGPLERANAAPNPRVAVDLTGWGAGGMPGAQPTLARAVPPVPVPDEVATDDTSPAIRATWVDASSSSLPLFGTVGNFPTVPGGTYTVSAYVLRPTVDDHSAQLVIGGATGWLGGFGSSGPSVGAWDRISRTVVASGTSISVQLWPANLTAASRTRAGRVTWAVGLLVEGGPLRAYFDGSTAPPTTAWAGVPHASASSYTPGTAEGSTARPRFVGRIVDAKLDAAAQPRPRLTLAATGPSARLASLRVGDTPWPVEDDGARAARILAAVVASDPSQRYVVPPTGTGQLFGRDVDAQPAARLFDELSDSTGGELVERRDGRLEYLVARDTVTPDLELTAAQIVGRPLWAQSLGGLVSDARVGYGTAEPQATARVVDTVAVEHPGLGRHEVRLPTQLATVDDATARATELVGRRSRPTWRIDALTLEPLRTMTDAQLVALLRLDVNALLTLTGLPLAAPHTTARLWLEGWVESYSRHRLSLALDVSDFGLTGAPPRPVDVPDEVTVDSLPPELSVLGSTGHYFGEQPQGRVVDVPSDVRVVDVPDDVTVATYDERNL